MRSLLTEFILVCSLFWASSFGEKKSDGLSEIKILSPRGGDIWKMGKYVWVYWDIKSVGNGPDRIDLDLYHGPGDGILMENISFGVPIGESASEWIAKKSLQQGSDYFIVVTSPQKRGFRVVSERFSIGKNGTWGQGNDAIASSQVSSQWLLSFLLVGLGMFVL